LPGEGVGGGVRSAEYRGSEAVGDELLQVLAQQAQLGVVVLARQRAGLGQQGVQRRITGVGGGGDVVFVQVVFAAVEQGLQHVLGGVVDLFGQQAGVQRLDRGGRA